jgi:hypothetical protein
MANLSIDKVAASKKLGKTQVGILLQAAVSRSQRAIMPGTPVLARQGEPKGPVRPPFS